MWLLALHARLAMVTHNFISHASSWSGLLLLPAGVAVGQGGWLGGGAVSTDRKGSWVSSSSYALWADSKMGAKGNLQRPGGHQSRPLAICVGQASVIAALEPRMDLT
jgi:hypothetical protein